MIGTRKDGSTPSHAWATFGNPYLYCKQCGQPVRHWHDDQQCGTPGDPCVVSWYLAPCGHQAAAASVCPTWAPELGCQCLAQLGRQDHATARR